MRLVRLEYKGWVGGAKFLGKCRMLMFEHSTNFGGPYRDSGSFSGDRRLKQ